MSHTSKLDHLAHLFLHIAFLELLSSSTRVLVFLGDLAGTLHNQSRLAPRLGVAIAHVVASVLVVVLVVVHVAVFVIHGGEKQTATRKKIYN